MKLRHVVYAVVTATLAAIGSGDIADALSAFEGMDTDVPVVEKAWLTPRQIHAGGVVDARLHITDGTGNNTVQVEYWGERPAAAEAVRTPVLWAVLESGTRRDGVWHVAIRTDPSLPPGTYGVNAWPEDVAENDDVVADLGTFTVLAGS